MSDDVTFEDWCAALDRYAASLNLPTRANHLNPVAMEQAFNANASPQEFLQSIGVIKPPPPQKPHSMPPYDVAPAGKKIGGLLIFAVGVAIVGGIAIFGINSRPEPESGTKMVGKYPDLGVPVKPFSPPPKPALSYEILEDRSDFDHHNKLIYAIKYTGSPVTKETLTQLLDGLYDQNIARIKEGGDPWVITFWAYPDREHFENGMGQWTAMLFANSAQPKDITFSEQAIKPLAEKERKLKRFSIEKEKQMYAELVAIEDRAERETEEAFPPEETTKDTIDAEGDLLNKLNEKYKAPFRRKYKLSEEEVNWLAVDAYESNWPIPKLARDK